jgi:hypothetical protein
MGTPNFVVETGVGLVDATSYTTTDFANTYHTNLGNQSWLSLSATTQQEALIQATQCMDLIYGPRYYSLPMSQSNPAGQPGLQALLFPRQTFVINRIQIIQAGTIPTQLQQATVETALMFTQGINLYAQPNQVPFIKNQTVKVGGLETATEFRTKVKSEEYPNFWKVERILKPILRNSGTPQIMGL